MELDSDWAGLPKHLLDLVSKSLVSSSDYLRFAAVCKSWHSAAKENQRQHTKMSRCQQPPMLLISSADKKNTWNLYDVLGNKVFNMQLRVPNKRFCGSSKGWLVFVDESFAVTLLNPFSMVKGRKQKTNSIITLPPLILPDEIGKKQWVQQCNYWVYKATLSADPILNADDCILAVIYGESKELAFMRPTQDTKWTYIDSKWSLIDEVVYAEDQLYAVDNNNILLTFDITSLSISEVAHGTPPETLMKRYLVDSNEQLLMVERYIDYGENLKRMTVKFKVFELDFNENMWIEKETLGDIALFVGDNSSISVLASDFVGCRSNCIYFGHDYDKISMDFGPCGPNDYGVYDIKNHRFSKPCTKYAKKLIKMTKRPPIWVVPTFQL